MNAVDIPNTSWIIPVLHQVLDNIRQTGGLPHLAILYKGYDESPMGMDYHENGEDRLQLITGIDASEAQKPYMFHAISTMAFDAGASAIALLGEGWDIDLDGNIKGDCVYCTIETATHFLRGKAALRIDAQGKKTFDLTELQDWTIDSVNELSNRFVRLLPANQDQMKA